MLTHREVRRRSTSTMGTKRRELSDTDNLLSKLGLKTFYRKKVTLQSLLEISKGSVYEEEVESLDKIPWCFLRKLFKMNAECRSCIELSNSKDNDEEIAFSSIDFFTTDDSADNEINPLDLIVALFLCADSFLQQEMASKMSMCQFSVPLLLPHGSNSQCTLMLWALRDIVKEWRPHELSESKGFVQDSLVQAKLPFYSFVRLKNCSFSKSELLNQALSLGQHSNNIFIHRQMKGGTNERKIASGLAEVCWYLPSGTKNLDIFSGPVGFANLRGDISASIKQFSFLLQVSTATFVFLDKVEEDEHNILTSHQDMKSKIVLVVNRNKGSTRQDMMSVKKVMEELELPNSKLKIKDPRENMAEFSDKLCAFIRKSMTNEENTVVIENMLDKAVELGLSVDENRSGGQSKAADMIVKRNHEQRITDYKKQHLPLQGDKWKRLSQIEMEYCRLKEDRNLDLHEYKSQLQKEKQKIKTHLGKHKPSTAMKCFIEHLSQSDKEKRDFFLKWMKIKLNAHMKSDTQLHLLYSKLKQECSKDRKDVKLVAEMDQALLDSSLGIEHYMREMGLIYEFSVDRAAEGIAHLPDVAAEMLLDGFPLELLDGDASNIPEGWVTDVLMELHKKVGEESRLLVVTVLGVQSTGKSTLLNTMFGVQFPVSSGRCTRGAYMLFLRVGEDMKNDLNCHFVVLIDTEGLRSPLLAHREDSYEHDNQLATFVIGLSDVTIINVAMENLHEMKDTLQIATHAFLRMKRIGKKPVCHFVHQNVAGVSAHTKTVTDRKHLLEQLNEMAKIAAEMEKQPSVKAFTDVLDYDIEKNHWNIPGLWHGTPPMASVSTGYSEAVADFKKNLLKTMSGGRGSGVSQIPEFLMWIGSLWKAVKYENFLFNFRNTLAAHAYDNICKEFYQWEWTFRGNIYSTQKSAVKEIHNAKEFDLQILVKTKKSVSDEIKVQEKNMKKKLQEYYKRKNIHIDLIREHKVQFFNSISSIAKEIGHSVNNKLDQALELKKSSKELQQKMETYREVIEEQVMKLVRDRQQSTLSDEELRGEFEKMWRKNTENVTGLKEQNICGNITEQLRRSFFNKKVNEFFHNIGDLKEHGKDEFKIRPEHEKGNFLSCVSGSGESDLKDLADKVIDTCNKQLADMVKRSTDYNECFTKDLLDNVHKSLEKCRYTTKFEFDLKVHICGIASREFLEMHEKFLRDNDPQIQLKKFKNQYLSEFLFLNKLRSTANTYHWNTT